MDYHKNQIQRSLKEQESRERLQKTSDLLLSIEAAFFFLVVALLTIGGLSPYVIAASLTGLTVVIIHVALLLYLLFNKK